MIYFTQDSGNLNIKIGYTGSDTPDGRTKTLQTGNSSLLVVLATMPGTQQDEDRLHQRFAAARVAGEWFRPVPELLRLIAQAVAAAEVEKVKPPPMVMVSPATEIRWPATIYLAGKISKRDWRHTIVAGLSETTVNSEILPEQPNAETEVLTGFSWQIRQASVFSTHHYAGPFFSKMKHKEFHGDDSHGVAATTEHAFEIEGEDCPFCDNDHCGCRHCNYGDATFSWATTTNNEFGCVTACKKAIESCDIFFAWIDHPDCFGTVAEIGYAAALRKVVWIAGPRRYRDMWFLYRLATEDEGRYFLNLHATSARTALATFLDYVDPSVRERGRSFDWDPDAPSF